MEIPNNWADVQPDTVYQTINGQQVSFSKEQIQLVPLRGIRN